MKDELGEKKMIKYAGLGVKTIENNDGSWSKITTAFRRKHIAI